MRCIILITLALAGAAQLTGAEGTKLSGEELTDAAAPVVALIPSATIKSGTTTDAGDTSLKGSAGEYSLRATVKADGSIDIKLKAGGGGGEGEKKKKEKKPKNEEGGEDDDGGGDE